MPPEIPSVEVACHAMPKGEVEEPRRTVPFIPTGSLLYRSVDDVPTSKSPLVDVESPVPPCHNAVCALAMVSPDKSMSNVRSFFILFSTVN